MANQSSCAFHAVSEITTSLNHSVDQEHMWKCPKDDDLFLTSVKSGETLVDGSQRERLFIYCFVDVDCVR